MGSCPPPTKIAWRQRLLARGTDVPFSMRGVFAPSLYGECVDDLRLGVLDASALKALHGCGQLPEGYDGNSSKIRRLRSSVRLMTTVVSYTLKPFRMRLLCGDREDASGRVAPLPSIYRRFELHALPAIGLPRAATHPPIHGSRRSHGISSYAR